MKGKMKNIYVWGIVGLVAILGLAVWGSSSMSQSKGGVKKYNVSESNIPKISSEQTNWSLGVVPFKLPTYKSVVFKNSGTAELTLLGASTSCGCTSVTFSIAGGAESPSFSMHEQPNWNATVEPNQEVLMKVKFDPSAHGVHGKVDRTIMVSSNDPKNPQFEFKFSAEVKD